MSLIPLSLIIFLGFLAVVCLFDFVFRLYWFKYFLATMGLIASGVVFFISFYGGGMSQTEIAIAIFIGSFGEYVVSLIISLVRFISRKSKKPKQKKKAKTA
ncbi:hypothetical protein HCB33_00170 [Listeria sp. FSL L7-0233]|uniref:hypothetical protein n=1 Tax=Listeria cossartiae TaxID=2838249 RepID=UPI0016279BEF|nr:hypothetical protein [Listeria cossartiae]MBC1545478.1 hypothetical protein [Listeria cossartiae subsp. cossartiae]MBC1545508.1 hypothetical protein [Listeria cossartiae subsp. cossartiae]MBC1548348.1 hypothetical protein [Listeria cossartiae subsp. cossartiae]MBC1568754.1 hypothetical protein [Listeria cossartiae subsp. cossartiae]MBC1572739.1 hypothetical protein [Listeria cossartiae subsp. cossartiae]